MPASSMSTRMRDPAVSLGLVLSLALPGVARAEPRAWIDPPARAASAPEAPKVPAPAASDDGLPKAAATPAARPDRKLAQEVAAPIARPRPAAGASSERIAAAKALAAQYLAAVSAPGEAMVGAAPRFYGAQVHFYGRATTLAALIGEKRSFVRRWPERRYEARTVRTTCDGERCTVRIIVDFRAANPDRGAVSRGAAELVLDMHFSGTRPVIVAETGRVLRRGVQASLAPSRNRA